MRGTFPIRKQGDRQMKKKPFRVLEERIKYHFIVIELFKRRNIFSFSVLTSIGDGGIGDFNIGAYGSYFEAKNAALRYIVHYHRSPLQAALLSKFRIMEDLDQPCLFDDLYL
jgi:hypothetical protein